MKNKVLENGRVVVLILATVFISISLLLTNRMAEDLHHKEMHDVELWAAAMERVNRDAMGDYTNDPLVESIINTHNNIPFIITDEKLRVISSHLIPQEHLNSPEHLHRILERMSVYGNHSMTVAFRMRTFSTGRSALPVLVPSIFSTVSMPSKTWPNTVYAPSK